MNNRDFFLGFFLGFLACVIGVFIFITFFTDFDFISGIKSMESAGKLGKLAALGAILDLVIFGVLLKLNKEMMARGVVLAVICIAIATIFA